MVGRYMVQVADGMSDYVTRAEFEEWKRQLAYVQQGYISARRLVLALGDTDTDPGVFANTSPDHSGATAFPAAMPGIAYRQSTVDASRKWVITDGTTDTDILVDGDIDLANIDAATLGGLSAIDLQILIGDAEKASACSVFCSSRAGIRCPLARDR